MLDFPKAVLIWWCLAALQPECMWISDVPDHRTDGRMPECQCDLRRFWWPRILSGGGWQSSGRITFLRKGNLTFPTEWQSRPCNLRVTADLSSPEDQFELQLALRLGKLIL